MKRTAAKMIVLIALGTCAATIRVHAQGRGPGDPSLDQPPVSPGEIQRMFDAYALVQAQEQLKLGDDQYPQFLMRYKALQDTRRRAQQERARIVQELRRLTAADAKPDEAPLKDRIKSLQDLDARSDADIRKAYEAVDQVLDIRQQAKFRVFEEQMERRKLELVTRARLNNRARKP